ncbi:Peroxisomal biogenesis factor 19 [Escovopsis weberi]|uniref:Peroxisomal biogenesis factor 19 n=1 Tax=Escovopsis weberi TaxID=150374 RepID=A0A0N0RTM3_ESCWE|nr:Peroxisomal biogenesis factor 19 [Escovopsis weberi]
MEATPGPAGASKNKGPDTAEGRPQAGAATATTTTYQVEVEDVSDPDEDDLDDLDDMLNDFSAAKIDPKPATSGPAPTVGSPSAKPGPKAVASDDAPNTDEDFNEEEFAKQLQEGMAGLLGELENSPEMQRQFEDMFRQMSEAAASEEQGEGGSGPAAAPASPKGAKSPSPDPNGEENVSFQDTIRRTMERMQSSGDQATAAAAAGGSDDFMAELLKQMTSGEFGGDGSEEDFSKMLMGMMEQLTNKDILYEPMKELHDKFPEWVAKNRDSTPADDMKRYQEQQRIVAEIVTKFDEPSYSDSNAADREYIVDRMQKVTLPPFSSADCVGPDH